MQIKASEIVVGDTFQHPRQQWWGLVHRVSPNSNPRSESGSTLGLWVTTTRSSHLGEYCFRPNELLTVKR